jgi:5-methylcytosine-specific restriction endonuclease McrA
MNDQQKSYHRDYYREYRKKESWKNYKKEQNEFYYNRLKHIVFDHYGLSCESCGESDFSQLSIDHINNDGAQHRKQLSMNGGGLHIYSWLIRNNFPDGFQTLCKKCNHKKWVEFKDQQKQKPELFNFV